MDDPKPDNVVDLRSEEKNTKESKPPKEKKPNWWKRLSKRQKMVFSVLAGLTLVLLAATIGYFVVYNIDPVTVEEEIEETVADAEPGEQTGGLQSPISGLVMNSTNEAYATPSGVMIENTTAARPQVGLINADVVYEVFVEAGITRFLAIYQSDYPSKIGPVRSARPYYVDIGAGYTKKFPLFFSGAAQFVYDHIANVNIRNASAAYNGPVYWRGEGGSPHNLYTSGENMVYKRAENGWDDSVEGEIDSWLFEEREAQSETSQHVEVPFSSGTYRVDWYFDAENNVYERSHGGDEHRDRETDERLSASTVVVVKTSVWPRPNDDKGRVEMDIVSDGDTNEGWIFKNGEEVLVYWKKTSLDERFHFYDRESGEEVAMQPGKIWVEVISEEVEVTVD